MIHGEFWAYCFVFLKALAAATAAYRENFQQKIFVLFKTQN
jgi:hypothetical protein